MYIFVMHFFVFFAFLLFGDNVYVTHYMWLKLLVSVISLIFYYLIKYCIMQKMVSK